MLEGTSIPEKAVPRAYGQIATSLIILEYRVPDPVQGHVETDRVHALQEDLPDTSGIRGVQITISPGSDR